jgi:tRNA(Ile)-lysidine synthase
MLAVAYSGGRDSTALLHLAARQASSLGLRVAALHVHHGLSPRADAWLAHCRAQCEAWAAQGLPIDFHGRRLDGRPAAAESVEAWAREGRYRALAEMARAAGAELLLLAQHRRDQAETFLLQALRGAGTAGLAAMPAAQWRADGLLWARPWLAQPREAIEAYLAEHRLAFIEDDSNTDPRYARNRLRLQVWPALAQAFPEAETGLVQAAHWAQQALALQRELAEEDLGRLADSAGLDWQGLTLLSAARASNALRAWLQRQLGRPAPASLVRRLLAQARPDATGAWPCAGGMLRCYRGRLGFTPAWPAAPAGPELLMDLSRPGLHPVPAWGGAWQVDAVPQGGLPAVLLSQARLCARGGGEQFQAHAKGLPRALKKAYQSAAVPAWQRTGPLLFAGERLLFVPGLGPDARALAAPGEEQRVLRWQPDPVVML